MMKPTGTLTVHPNPIQTTDPSGLAVVTLSWTFEGTDVVEVRVGAPDGPLFSRSTSAHSMTTGSWVRDGTTFCLQDASAGVPLAPEHTLASVTVKVLAGSARAGPKALVLMYHRIADVSPDPWSLCVKPRNFAEHLGVLRDTAQVLPLSELLGKLGQGKLLQGGVVITFDDGYADNLDEAKPLLERFGTPATVFVTSGYIGREREFWWDELEQLILRGATDRLELYRSLHQMLHALGDGERRELLDQLWGWARAVPQVRPSHRPLSPDELAALASCELFDIGAHTLTHAVLPHLSRAQQRAEIMWGKARLEEILERPVLHFAYPHGRFNDMTIDIVQRAGFTCGCTVIPEAVSLLTDPFQLPRLAVEDWDGEELSRRLQAWFKTGRRTAAGAAIKAEVPERAAPSDARQRADVSEQRLRQAEDVRKQVSTGLRAFQAQFDSALNVYRSQRAWRVMLLLRQAYTLLVRNRTVIPFLKWLGGLPWLPGRVLHLPELSFPRVDSYVPPLLSSSFLPDPSQPSPPPPAATKMPRQSKYDVLFLPVFEFDFRLQRPQQLAMHFAQAGHRVFWISPTRLLSHSSDEAFAAVLLRDNLWEIHLRGRCPDIYRGELDDKACGTLLKSLKELYREWAIAETVAMIQLPFWRSLGLGLREQFGARLVFDCMDDWESMPDIGEFNRSEERRLVEECDLLVLTARQLLEKFGAQARRSVLVRNAVDYSFFTAAVGRNESLAGVRRPIVGYMGAIASWFDCDLLYEVATSRPQYSFVLIGAFGLEEDVIGDGIARVRQLPNVHLLGHRSYAELPSYLSCFDACIIPFVINQVTHATDPVKLYEYLSHGKPVVATGMPELADRSHLMYLAADAPDFASKLDQAVAEEDEQLNQRRRSYAARNTWSQRVDIIDDELKKTFPPVSILIVTYNSLDYLDPCLDSIFRNTSYPNYELIVVDNNSRDGTRESLQDHARLEPRIRTISLPENKGFAAANNAAARQARGDYFLLLNVDTLVTPGWVERLLRHARLDPSIGMVVPATNWAGNEAKINVEYTDVREMEEFALALAREKMGLSLDISVAPFFCALVPRAAWDKIGGLDERFEIGMFEDDDFSLRARRLNYRIVVAEDCFVHHFGRGSFSKLSPSQYEKVFKENLRRFEDKWGIRWMPHRHRDGVRPEHVEFDPQEFTATLRE